MPENITPTTSDQEIRDALANAKSIAVIGLSPDPSRASNHVTEYLIEQGYDIGVFSNSGSISLNSASK